MRPSSRRQNVVQAWAGAVRLKAIDRAAAKRTWRNCARMLVISSKASLRQNAAPGFDHLGVEPRARLGGTAQGLEIDVDDAEPLRVAVAPFEVVEEGPGEIAAQ